MQFTSGVDFLISSIIIIFIKLSLFFLYFFRICPCCFLEAGCSSDCCHDLLTTLEDFGFRFGYEPIFFRFSIWLFIFDLLKLFLLPPFLVCLPFFICNYKDHMRIILNNTSISCSKINIQGRSLIFDYQFDLDYFQKVQLNLEKYNQIHIMNMQIRITNTKLDVCFANSLKATKNSFVRQVVLHFIQFIAMVAMIPLDIYVFNHSNEEVLSFFITASCITFINLVSKLSHLICRLGDPATVMSIALELNHVVEEQPNSERLGEQFQANPTLAVSEKVYNIQNNMTVEEATPTMQQMVEPALSNVIKTLALSRDPLNRCTISLGSGISFALFIYGIVILATVSEMKTGQIIVMSLFLVSEFLIQIQVFLCLIFIALIPVLCIFICFYACFCKEGHREAKLPGAVSATVDIIQKSDGSPCSICFQNIMLDEQVIILPCSDKHVFHVQCIATWTAVKPTCPICRHDLSQ